MGANPLPEMVTGLPDWNFSMLIGFWRIPDADTGNCESRVVGIAGEAVSVVGTGCAAASRERILLLLLLVLPVMLLLMVMMLPVLMLLLIIMVGAIVVVWTDVKAPTLGKSAY